MLTFLFNGTYLAVEGTSAGTADMHITGSPRPLLLLQAPVQNHQQSLLPDIYIRIYVSPVSELAPLLPLTSHLRIHFSQAVLQLHSIAMLRHTYRVSANSPPSLPTGFQSLSPSLQCLMHYLRYRRFNYSEACRG